jgi:putative MATE family efflux protein
MKDLTQGPITNHLVKMSVPIVISLLFQTLYYLVDLYFIAPLGGQAIAGVGTAGNVTFIVLALTQILGAGAVALVSQAAGRKDKDFAGLAFNQAMALSAVGAMLLLVLGYATAAAYLNATSADAATAHAGTTYLMWFLPSLALQFPLVVMGAGLRATGNVQTASLIQVASVLLNAILAPFLIAGWVTRHGMGVAGAGLASSIAVAAAVVALWAYVVRGEYYVGIDPRQWRPQYRIWGRLLDIGLPAGAEYLFLFVNVVVTFWAIRQFGSAAQAGYGAGSRIMNAILLPAIAIAFAAGPLAGQNYGAGRTERVTQTFKSAALIISSVMVVLTLLVQIGPSGPLQLSTSDPAVLSSGGEFLRLLSWNFVAQGLIFLCSSMFQGLGNTRPALISSGGRLVIFVVPVIVLSQRSGFSLDKVWYLSIATVSVQALASLALLRREFRRRLDAAVPPSPAAPAEAEPAVAMPADAAPVPRTPDGGTAVD